MAPRVSVLVNNRDYGRFLGQALQSVLDQDFPRDLVEVICVDDASTDESRSVLERYAPRVRAVYRTVNGGQAAAFNDGFAAAAGEILCLLDSDDWWAPEKLKKVVARFDAEPDLGMVQHWCREIGPDGRPLPARYPALPARWTAEDFLAGRCVFTGTTGLSFRASAARRVLPVPPALRICADEHLYSAALDAPVGNIPEVLAFRRVHGANRYAARLTEPTRLAEHRRALDVLARSLDERLKAAGRTLGEAPKRRARQDALLDDLFLARHEGRWADAGAAWKSLATEETGLRGIFKRISLSLILVSPSLYLGLQSAYRRLRNG